MRRILFLLLGILLLLTSCTEFEECTSYCAKMNECTTQTLDGSFYCEDKTSEETNIITVECFAECKGEPITIPLIEMDCDVDGCPAKETEEETQISIEQISFITEEELDAWLKVETITNNMTQSGKANSDYLNMSQLFYKGKEVDWVYQEEDIVDEYIMRIVPCIVTVDGQRYCERET